MTAKEKIKVNTNKLNACFIDINILSRASMDNAVEVFSNKLKEIMTPFFLSGHCAKVT